MNLLPQTIVVHALFDQSSDRYCLLLMCVFGGLSHNKSYEKVFPIDIESFCEHFRCFLFRCFLIIPLRFETLAHLITLTDCSIVRNLTFLY